MLSIFAAALVAISAGSPAVSAARVSPCAGPARNEVSAAVPGTQLQISLEAPGHREDPALRAQLAKEVGEAGVLGIAIEPARSTLAVVVSKDEPRRTSAAWRDELARDGERFQVEGPHGAGAIACRELVTRKDVKDGEQVNTRYDAYVVAGGLVFDLHVSTWSDADVQGLSRRSFQRIVESFRVSFVRHGKPSDLSRDAREAMHRALSAWPDWQPALAAHLARKPQMPDAQFVVGEMLLLSDAERDQVVEAHGAALESLQRLRTPSAELRFAWMLCAQSVGLALVEAEDAPAAIPHLEKSLEISRQLRSPARTSSLYGLARAHARTGDAGAAMRCLDEAIRAEPRLRDLARREPAFDALSDDKRYQALVRR
jgi:hypothetical protein